MSERIRYTNLLPFTRSIREQAGHTGLPNALSEAFTEANIDLLIRGDTTRWDRSGTPTLLLGDHRSGLERLPLMAAFGQLDRSDIQFIAVPHSIAAKITKALDPEGNDYTLPVLPGLLASDRGFQMDRYTKTRVLHHGSLPTRDEIRQLNKQTFQDAAGLLEQGFAVNIFPAGHVDIDIHEQWPKGTGEILARVPDEVRKHLIVVPYRFEDDYTRERLAKSLTTRSLGKKPKERIFTLTIGDQKTAHELIGSEQDPRIISDRLQDHYIAALNPPVRN